MESEGARLQQINIARGEAEAIQMRADANALMISKIAVSIKQSGSDGKDAVAMAVAEKYIEAFGEIAKESTTVIVPSNLSDASSLITQAMTVFDNIKK